MEIPYAQTHTHPLMPALLPCFFASELHTSFSGLVKIQNKGVGEDNTSVCERSCCVCIFVCVCICLCYLPDPGVFEGYGGVTYFNCLAWIMYLAETEREREEESRETHSTVCHSHISVDMPQCQQTVSTSVELKAKLERARKREWGRERKKGR